MRKTITTVAFLAVTAAALATWATANSATKSQAVASIDPLALMKTAKDMPLQQVDNPF